MTTTRTWRCLAPLTVLALSSACSSFTDAGGSMILDITALDAPATIANGTQLTVVATVVTGGCVSFNRLDASRTASRLTLVARGTDHGGPAISCPADIRHEPHAYVLTVTRAGTFVITSHRVDGSDLTRNVQVQ